MTRPLSQSFVRAAYRTAARGLEVVGLKAAVRTHVLPRLLAAAQSGAAADGHTAGLEAATFATVDREIRTALEAPGKILVGPWTSEVGFELLYWVPLLRWICETYSVPPDRLIAVTRGGAGVWYDGLAGETVELFASVDPADFRRETEARWRAVGGQKQIHIDAWDHRLLDIARQAHPDAGAGVLHPYLMYALFYGVWQGQLPLSRVVERTRFAALPDPPTIGVPDLPERYAAVRFYFRPSFPDTPENRRFAGDVVARMAAKQPVVMLNPRLEIDDHSDWMPTDTGHAVVDIGEAMTPSNNLTLQSAVIARAEAFVGTYGGLSYLAPLYGRPSIAFASDPVHNVALHGELADIAARAAGGSLTILESSRLALFDRLFGE